MIVQNIQHQIQEAMKSKDELRISTLKMLSSALGYAKIELQHELSENEELAVVVKEIKKRTDAIDAYEKAKALDRAEVEKQERDILREFLPPLMPMDELSELVAQAITETGAKEMRDMSKVIEAVSGKVGLRAESATIAKLAREKLMS